MKIAIDREAGTLTLDDVTISLRTLKQIINPENRVLYRFHRDGDKVVAVPFCERDIIWLDPPERESMADPKETS